MSAAMSEYSKLYDQSIHDPQRFWGVFARNFLSWDHDFHTTQNGSFAGGDVSWFLGGRLNASFNCIDRHALRCPNKIAINYVSDDGTNDRSLTYRELLAQVCSLAGTLRAMGVNKGDVVTIYLPMIPEAAIAMLACARIGAVHSVVFAGFSADALADRIVDARSRVLITADEGRRGGKAVRLKEVVDEAVAKPSCAGLVSSVLVHRYVGVENLPWTEDRDRWWHEEQERQPRYIEPVSISAEDPLFLLYTSGSTGKPKGVQHTIGGYLLGAATTGKYVLGLGQNVRLFCAGDVGWITGHTYAVYSPLILGATTVIFEGTPVFPTPSRYWEIVDRLQVTHFYAAPTALRLLKRLGNDHVTPFVMQHLRVLASVGEPIAPEVWTWYHDVVGRKKCSVVDVSLFILSLR
jgi:acetyl-CoA synthetase